MLNDATDALGRLLPPGVLRDAAPAYFDEPRGRYKGRAGLIAAPRNVEEVAAVVRACAEAGVPIVPRGGGTGLVGGQVMAEGAVPLLLSLERMNAIRAIYPEEGVIVLIGRVLMPWTRGAGVRA